MVSICCRLIKVALAVAADLKQQDEIGDEVASTPLHVNTDAIGANAVFASIKTMSETEEMLRTAGQRIIVSVYV